MLKTQNFQDFRKKASQALDNRVRAITAGLGLKELRAVLRGDPPTEKHIRGIRFTPRVSFSISDPDIMKEAARS